MKKTLIFFTVALLFLLVAVNTASAQFEGKITFLVYDYTDQQSENPAFSITSTNERLQISSDQNIDVITGLKANGILIRNDLNDFVFNTDKDQALKVTKEDLDGLMNMIERFGGAAKNAETERFDWESGVEETGNTRTHLGYELHELRLKGDRDNQYASIWLTGDIKMKWGLMIEVWDRIGNRFSDAELPIELVMNPHSFPLLFEVYDRDNLLYKIESQSVETLNFDRSVVELPDDKALLGLSELMMNMFRERR